MNRHEFLDIVKEAFFFLDDFDFIMDEFSVSGRMYSASFTSPKNVLTVSYEPGEDNLIVFLFSIENGRISNVDDPNRTLRLKDLNRKFMKAVTTKERAENERAFNAVLVKDPANKLLLKAAKELRLVLPKYFNSLKG